MIKYTKQEDQMWTVTVGEHSVKNVILLTIFRSHLHGTNNENSDRDYKAIFLADLKDIVLGNEPKTINLSSNQTHERNTSSDVDIEFVEFRKFLNDLYCGHTYAIEMVNITPEKHAVKNDDGEMLYTKLFEHIQENKMKYLTNELRHFVGYCVGQARKYGIKGEKLRCVEDVLDVLESEDPKKNLVDVLDKITLNEYVKKTSRILEHQNKEVYLLDVAGKEFDMNQSVKSILPPLQAVVKNSGKRTRDARDGVDWKAVAHAYRVAYELEEFVETGSIQFPLRMAAKIKEVKEGRVPYQTTQDELSELVERATNLEMKLPLSDPRKEIEELVLSTYCV